MAECLAENGLHGPARLNASELGFRLSFKLNFAELYRNDSRDSFQHVIAGECFALFRAIAVLNLRVQGARKRRLETRDVHPSLAVVNVIRKSGYSGCDVVHILESDFHLHAVPCPAIWRGELFFHVENSFVHRLKMPVVERDERAQTSLKIKCDGGGVYSQFAQVEDICVIDVPQGRSLWSLKDRPWGTGFSNIQNCDAHPAHQVRLLAHVRDNRFPTQFTVRENGRV